MNRSGESNRKTNDSSSYSGKVAFSTSSLIGPRDKPAKASRMPRRAGSQGHYKNRRPTKTSGSNVVVPLPIKAKSVFTESEMESGGAKVMTQSGPLSKESKSPDSNSKKIPPSTVWGEGTRNFLVDENSQTELAHEEQQKDLPHLPKSVYEEKTDIPLQSQDVRKLSMTPKNPVPSSDDDIIRMQLKQEEAERLAYEREQQLKREDAKRFREMEVASVTRQGMEDYGTAKVVVNQPTEEPPKLSVPVVNITASASAKAAELSNPRVPSKKGLPRRPPGDTNFYRVVPEEESFGSRRMSADRRSVLNDRLEMSDRRGMRRGGYESLDRRIPKEDSDRIERRSVTSEKEGMDPYVASSDREKMKKRQPFDAQEKRYSNRTRDTDRFRKWSTERMSHLDRTTRTSHETSHETGHETADVSSRPFSSHSNRSTHQTSKQTKPSQKENAFFLEGPDYDQYISNQQKWKSVPVTREYRILDNGELSVGVDLDEPVEIPSSELVEEKIEETSTEQPVSTLPSFSTQSSSPVTASGTQSTVPSQMYVAPMFQQSYPNASVFSAQSMYQSGQNDFNYPTPLEYYWSSMQQPYNYMVGMSSYTYIPGPVIPVRGNSNGFVSYDSGNNGIDKDFS